MNEKYNKYNQNLNLDCDCGNKKPPITKTYPNNNCCCEGGLPSHSNKIEILIRQLKREVKELMTTTQAKLLCQDKKIAEVTTYIKNNLSNALRELLDTMIQTGEIDDLITSIISDNIVEIQTNIDELNNKVNQNTADIQVNANEVAKKVEFKNYISGEINRKFQNVEFTTEYINDSIVYITKIKNIDKIACLPTNSNVAANPQDNRISVKDYANTHSEYDLYINGGMNGVYIFDSIVNSLTRLDCPYYCGLTYNNEMKFYDGLNNTITGDYLINDGIVNCWQGFAPLVVNHTLADYTSLNNLYGSNEIATAFIDSLPVKHPRQILGQDDDNNFYIYSIMGRFNNSDGMNYDEMKSYCMSKGLKNAFNMDGGGSMQTIYNNNYVFFPSQELDTNIDRIVPSCIGFKIKEV